MDRRVPDNQPSSSSSNQQNNAAHVPPDAKSPSKTIIVGIDFTKNLVERCLRLYMTKNETKDALFKIVKIETLFTECVWQKLEEENPEFFKAYYLRLMAKDLVFRNLDYLFLQERLMTETCSSGLQGQQSPACSPTGNPAIQHPRIPFPSADHGNLLGLQMNFGMGRSENVASESTSSQQNNAAHVPPDANSPSETITFITAFVNQISKTKKLIEKCMRLYMPKKAVKDALFNVAKIETVFTEFVWQKLEERNPKIFKSYYARLMLSVQANNFDSLLWQLCLITNDCPRGIRVQVSPAGLPRGNRAIQQPPIPVPSANHGNFSNENPQSLSLGLDGEQKSSTGVLTSDPTAEGSNLPATGNPGIQQPPFPSPSAGHGSSLCMQVNSEIELVAWFTQVLHLSSSVMSWTFDSRFKSRFEKPIPQPQPQPTADLSILPDNQSDSEEEKLQQLKKLQQLLYDH